MVGTRPGRTRPDVTVGHLLQQARERRGEDLSAIALEIKVPQRQLQALEEGNLAVFPAEIYARGAFTKYSQYLGVQAEATQRAFLRVLSGTREYVPLRVRRPRSWLKAWVTARLTLAAALLTLALLVGSYVAWQVASFVRLPDLSVSAPAGGIVPRADTVIRGKAAAGAEVRVNGEQVLQAESGEFETPLKLHPGINVVRVEAKNAAGRINMVQRDILLPRS